MDAVLPCGEVCGSGAWKNGGGRRAGEHDLRVEERPIGKENLCNFYMACPCGHVQGSETRTRSRIKVSILAVHVSDDGLHSTIK